MKKILDSSLHQYHGGAMDCFWLYHEILVYLHESGDPVKMRQAQAIHALLGRGYKLCDM